MRDFNSRLQAGGAPDDYVFSETPISAWLPAGRGAPVYNEFFLALEEGAVRGAYALKHQEFWCGGERRPLVYYHHPFGEGIVDKKYAQVGLHMLMHVMRENPLLFALGMGGYDRPLPRMLMALKWPHCTIPFYFRAHHGGRFLRHLETLRTSAAKRAAADILAATGAGWLGFKLLHGVLGAAGMAVRAEAEPVGEFGPWADSVWEECHGRYSMLAVRDARSLRTLYPAANPRLTRLKISRGGQVLGWAVIGMLHRPGHVQYGDMRVGTILDGLAKPEHAKLVISAATRELMRRGADLITSNQSHEAWQGALKACGFLQGPSNYIFAVSKKLSELMQPFDKTVGQSHINRGDGDNLLQYA